MFDLSGNNNFQNSVISLDSEILTPMEMVIRWCLEKNTLAWKRFNATKNGLQGSLSGNANSSVVNQGYTADKDSQKQLDKITAKLEDAKLEP